MNHHDLGGYIVSHQAISIPELQKEFNLSYSVVRKYIQNLILRGKISKFDELSFSYIRNEDDPFFIYALWLAIKKNDISLEFLQREFTIDQSKAKEIIDWMSNKGYIRSKPFMRVTLTKEKFLTLYASLDFDCSSANAFLKWKSEDEEQVKKYINEENKKGIYTDKEYYDVLVDIFTKNSNCSKGDFISVIQDKCSEYENDNKMILILMRIFGHITCLNEKEFQDFRKKILS